MKLRLLILAILTTVAAAQTVLPNTGITVPQTNGPYVTIMDNNLQIIDGIWGPSGPAMPALHVTNLTVTGTCTGCTTANAVPSVFGRTGAISAQNGDYSFSQITGTISTSQLSTTGSGAELVTSSGLSAGLGAQVCEDAYGGIKDVGCSTAAGGAIIGSPGSGVNQAITQQSGTIFKVNRFEDFRYADGFTGGSSTGGIAEALADCSQCTVVANNGSTTACNLNIPSNVRLTGYGIGASVISCNNAAQPVIASMGANSEIDHLTIKHSVQPTCVTSAACGDGISTGAAGNDRIIIHDMEIQNNYNNLRLGSVFFAAVYNIRSEYCEGSAVLFDKSLGYSDPVMQWHLTGYGLLEQCARYGIEFNNTTGLTTSFDVFDWDIYGNQLGGILYQGGSSATRISDLEVLNNTLSTNNGFNIYVNSYGRNVEIAGGLNELAGQFNGSYGYNQRLTASIPNTGSGVVITGNCDPTGPALVHDVKFWENSNNGVDNSCTGTLVYGNMFFDSGYGNPGTNTGSAGVAIKASQTSVIGNWFGAGNGQMLTAIDVSNSADKPNVMGNMLGTGVNNLLTLTTAPTNGFQEQVGNIWMYQNSGAPVSGNCTATKYGSIYSRTDSSTSVTSLYGCKNVSGTPTWVGMN